MEAIATAVFVMALGIVGAFTLGWVLANTGGMWNAKDIGAYYAAPSESARQKIWVRPSSVLFWIGFGAIFAVGVQPMLYRVWGWLR